MYCVIRTMPPTCGALYASCMTKRCLTPIFLLVKDSRKIITDINPRPPNSISTSWDQLTEQTPVVVGVMQGHAGDAGNGSGGEHGILEGCALSVPGSRGQHQQTPAQQDQRTVAQHDHLGCGHASEVIP